MNEENVGCIGCSDYDEERDNCDNGYCDCSNTRDRRTKIYQIGKELLLLDHKKAILENRLQKLREED